MKKKLIKKLKNELQWWSGYQLGLDHAVDETQKDLSFISRNRACENEMRKIKKLLLKEKKCKNVLVA